MKTMPISIPKILSRLRSQLRRIEAAQVKLEAAQVKLDSIGDIVESLASDIGDDLLFLEREFAEFKKLSKTKPN